MTLRFAPNHDRGDVKRRQSRARERLRYRIDTSLSNGVGSIIGLLAVVTLIVVVLAGLFLWIADVSINGDNAAGAEGVWASLVRTLDPGTMGADRGWTFRFTSLAVTIAGIFIVSTLIGLLANGISQRLDLLRRGRSKVIESSHLLVLGWSPKLYVLVSELSVVARRDSPLCVVVLADRDVVEMAEELRLRLGVLPHTRVVFRSGSSTSPQALQLVSPMTAKSIVVLKSEGASDAHTVQTALALERLGVGRDVAVVLEIEEERHARALMMASELHLVPVVSERWIGMITARAVQSPELTDVYEDLLNFGGAEVYFVPVPVALAGQRLIEAVEYVRGAAVFGIRRDGNPILGASPNTVLDAGDDLIVVADHNADVRFTEQPRDVVSRPSHDSRIRSAITEPAHVLILGWSELGDTVLRILDQSLPPGSMVDIVSPGDSGAELPEVAFQRFSLRTSVGDTTDPSLLERVVAPSSVHRILVLSGHHNRGEERDAEALLTMLQLRRLLAARPEVRIAVEIANPANADLVGVNAQEEFIVGERLVCMLMSQMSHTVGLMEVLDSLLSDDDADLTVIDTCDLEIEDPVVLEDLARPLRALGHYVVGVVREGGASLCPDLLSEPVSGRPLVVVVSNRAAAPVSAS